MVNCRFQVKKTTSICKPFPPFQQAFVKLSMFYFIYFIHLTIKNIFACAKKMEHKRQQYIADGLLFVVSPISLALIVFLMGAKRRTLSLSFYLWFLPSRQYDFEVWVGLSFAPFRYVLFIFVSTQTFVYKIIMELR